MFPHSVCPVLKFFVGFVRSNSSAGISSGTAMAVACSAEGQILSEGVRKRPLYGILGDISKPLIS